MQVDHVVLAVRDLEDAVDAFEDAHGLLSVPGGRHPGWGTANRIVPLGDAYLELMAVVDRDELDAHPLADLLRAQSEGARFIGWVVRPTDLDATAERLGLTIESGGRQRPDGTEVRWRLAGVQQATSQPSLPFFIEWEEGNVLPGRATTGTPARLVSVALTGDGESLSRWLGPNELPYTIEAGPPGVQSVDIETSDGRIIAIAG